MTTLLGISSVALCAQPSSNDQLKNIKRKITQQTQLLDKQKKQQDRLNKQLKNIEQQVAKSAKSLHQTKQQQRQTSTKRQQLKKQQTTLLSDKKKQQRVLSKQLKSAYMTGDHDLMQMLLNQQQSSKTERLLGYYQFLNKARIASITELSSTIQSLTDIAIELNATALELSSLLKAQQQHEQQLSKEKTQRNSALRQLKLSYSKNSTQLERYQLSEIDIKQLLNEQQKDKTQSSLPLNGLAGVRGLLPRPSRGKIIHKFGQRRHGNLRRKGITISGIEGQSVTAIHHGKVIFSNWIKGFGLVLVLDHGKGYMSLYGHNQALLKDAGDVVAANEKIALLGQSGGQSKPALYFEIRYQGKAVSPTRWFK